MTHRETPLRRRNPSGTVVWVARYTGPDGKRRSAGTFKLKRRAQDAIDQAYAQIVPVERRTFGQYADDWTTRYPRAPRTNVTNDNRIARVRTLVVDGRALEDWPLAELRRRHARDLADLMLRDQGRAVSGVRNILNVLSAMCEDAITDEILVGNPFKGVRLRDNDPRARKEPRARRVWTFEQMHQFAAHAGAYEAMVRMLADCGLRVGELLALRRDEQDLRAGMFRVSGSAWNGQVVASSREKRHDRVGPIPPGCLSLLREMPVRIDSPWLFPTPGQRRVGKVGRDMPGGLLWRYENWKRQVWTPTTVRAGADPTPQEFRRSYNSLLLAQGIDRADLADVLGHGVDVNADRYTQALRRSGDQIRSVIG